MDFHSVSSSGSTSSAKLLGTKPPSTQTILPQSAGVPGSSAFLYIPHRSTRSSKLTPPPAPKLNYSQDASLSSKSSSISERPVTPSSPAHSTNKNMVSSNNSVQTPHQSPIQNKSRPISTSSRFSRQNAREADVLGKILGWRHSKTLRTSTSFKSSPRSQPKQTYFKQIHSPNKHNTPSKSLIKSTLQQELPEIFRPSSSRISSSVPRPSQDGAFPNPSLVQQQAQEDTQTSTKKHSTSSRPYLTQQSSSDLTSSTHASSNPSSSVTHAGSSQTSFHLLPPSSPVAAHLLSSSNESSQHQPPNGPIKPFALRRPVLKKSFSSGQLHQHFNLTQDPSKPHSQSSAPSHTPQSTQPSSLASSLHIPERFNHQPTTSDRPNSLVVPDETNRIVPASRSQLINAPYASQPHHRFSLPSMHAVLDADPSLSDMIQLDYAPSDDSHYSAQLASPLPKHPSMHGVASNESIRTAKPNTEFKSLNALSALPSLADDDSPSPRDAHRNNVSPSDHDASTSTVRRPRRFQNPRIFDIFTPVHRREPVDPMRRFNFLSPELTGSSAPSETSSNPSQPQSLGVSVNSSLNSSHLLGPLANLNSAFNKDPRFVIWAENPASSLRQKPAASIYSASLKRSSATIETRHYPQHPASASTSHLGIDHSTGRLTHAPNSTSLGFSSPSNLGTSTKRWSRSVKTPTSHHFNVEPTSNSSPNLAADIHHLPDDNNTRRKSREELPHTHPTASQGTELIPKLGHDRILMAATIERWVAELTTHIDSMGLAEFFFTYRAIMTPTELAHLLASRFEWSIMFRSSSYAKRLPEWNLDNFLVDPDLEKGILGLDGRLLSLDNDGESLRRVAKVRTFVMIRHWLLNHFEDDFLLDVPLQTAVYNWLENLTEKIKRIQRIIYRLENHAVSDSEKLSYQTATTPTTFSGEEDLKILKNLRKVFKELQATHHQSFNVVAREKPDSTSQTDGTSDQKHGRLNRKLPKVDVRELFKEADKRNDQSPARRNRRSHTADVVALERSLAKTHPGHARAHSANTLAQVRAANFAKTDLRLCDPGDPDKTSLSEVLRADENPRRSTDDPDFSTSNEKLITKLKQVFESDTRRHRDGVHHQFHQKESDSDPTRFSFIQSNSTLPTQHQRQLMMSRMRAPDNSSEMPKSLVTAQTRSNMSNHTSASFNQGGLPFPQHHNPFHRYFTTTMGTIGRFKRMINNRSGPHLASNSPAMSGNHYVTGIPMPVASSVPLSGEPGSQQEQSNEIGDLLCAKGDLDRYLSFFEIQKDSSISSYEDKLDKESVQMDGSDLSTAEAPTEAKLGLRRMAESEEPFGSPVVQYDDLSESQLSLSSSLSYTTCTSESMPSENEGEPKIEISGSDPVMVSTEENLIDQSASTPNEHLLHGSMSTETIKSEAHHLPLPGGGMDLLKKQLRKKFTNKDMCPVLMRASMDESFSGPVPDYSNSLIRHSEDSPRVNTFSINVSSPHGEKDMGDRPTSVQLDDIDLMDSDEDSPVGVQKLRRLPGAVDLKQAIAFGRKSIFNLKGGLMKGNDDRSKRFSTETSSSIGTRRVPSIAGSMFRRSKLSHRPSVPNSIASSLAPSALESTSSTEPHDTGIVTPGVVANFVADGLESDDDEPGDVEAALRRLEGVIDADREKEKARKVELQMIKSMEVSRRTRSFSRYTGSQCSFSSQTDEADEARSESAEGDDHASEESDEDKIDANEEEEEEEEEEGDEEDDSEQEEQDEEEHGEEDGYEDNDENAAEHEHEQGTETQLVRKSISSFLDRSGMNSPIAEGDEEETDTPAAPTPKLSPMTSDQTDSSKLPASDLSQPPTTITNEITAASKPGIRFFSDHSKGLSLDDSGMADDRSEDHSKTLRGNGKRLATRSQQVMTRKGSLHKLFSSNQHVGKASGPTKQKGPSGGIPLPSYNMTTGKPTIMHSLPLPPVHRSFLLDCRTEILAQQFCLIERDLLRNITWQELLLSKWQEDRSSSQHHGNLNGGPGPRGTRRKKGTSSTAEDAVTCWETFMKQRAKEKMRMKGRIQNQHPNLTSLGPDGAGITIKKLEGNEINALIMRFNLTCNWVASELVLTANLDERVALLGKFIRLAFKCYRQNNFQTLTQIIHGLQTPYVERLKKTWSKLGIWESRMFRDLKEFTSHLSNFKSLRNVQDSLISDSPSSSFSTLTQSNNPSAAPHHSSNNNSSPNVNIPSSSGGSTAHYTHTSDVGAGRTSHTYSRATNSVNACIPFLGLYLRDLTVNDELPTYLDPTDPSIPVEIDRMSGKLKKLSNPQVFENLPSLPSIGGQRLTTEGKQQQQQQQDESEVLEYGYYPLVNINKLRTYAKIILKIVEFQNRSIKNYTFETDSKWFLTCLKIKCLSSEQIRLLSRTCEP